MYLELCVAAFQGMTLVETPSVPYSATFSRAWQIRPLGTDTKCGESAWIGKMPSATTKGCVQAEPSSGRSIFVKSFSCDPLRTVDGGNLSIALRVMEV